ncbi:hypothetical protein CC78DRAFT_30486 [Lojkania enalia]|uniref:Uncharacterized protein n=1 Tax=Lojkania enalia TaxID=147567 RepID=A0A9P4KHJ6_9PLEO|nr:hypothetical protein CC78DRAFT_30486 [Didymosphaeria enalia]
MRDWLEGRTGRYPWVSGLLSIVRSFVDCGTSTRGTHTLGHRAYSRSVWEIFMVFLGCVALHYFESVLLEVPGARKGGEEVRVYRVLLLQLPLSWSN